MIKVKEIRKRAWYIIDFSPLPEDSEYGDGYYVWFNGEPVSEDDAVTTYTKTSRGYDVRWIYYILNMEVSRVNALEAVDVSHLPPLPRSHPGVEIKIVTRPIEKEPTMPPQRVCVLNKKFASRADAVNSFQDAPRRDLDNW